MALQNTNSQTETAAQKCKALSYEQLRVADWYAAKGLVYWDLDKFGVVKRPSASALARELGISRQTIYDWPKTIPDFDKHVQRALEGIIQINIGAVWNAVFMRAARGDVRQAELYLTNFAPNFVPLRHRAKSHSHEKSGLLDLLNEARKLRGYTQS